MFYFYFCFVLFFFVFVFVFPFGLTLIPSSQTAEGQPCIRGLLTVIRKILTCLPFLLLMMTYYSDPNLSFNRSYKYSTGQPLSFGCWFCTFVTMEMIYNLQIQRGKKSKLLFESELIIKGPILKQCSKLITD